MAGGDGSAGIARGARLGRDPAPLGSALVDGSDAPDAVGRMVVTRVRFANGRLVPFAQVGVGEWPRPTRRSCSPSSSASHAAAQLGGGFELELAPRASLAAASTMLYQEGHTLDPIARRRASGWPCSPRGHASSAC